MSENETMNPHGTTSNNLSSSREGGNRTHGQPLKMLEFFSGIGGMRCALERALSQQQQQQSEEQDDSTRTERIPALDRKERRSFQLTSCQAFEINLQANQVYRHNFDHDIVVGNNKTSSSSFGVHTKLVEQLKVHQVANYDIWTLSAPCQPFTTTRFAKQQDLQDKRTHGLVALLQRLEELAPRERPRWILMENVPGFVTSQARTLFLNTLQGCGYTWQEYLLSPTALGIPNHRQRYYILCEASNRFAASSSPLQSSATDKTPNAQQEFDTSSISRDFPQTRLFQSISHAPRQVQEYLDDKDTSEDWNTYGLSHETLSQPWARDLPLVAPHDTHSHCVTAFYGRQLHASTGSLLLLRHNQIQSITEATAQGALDRSNMVQYEGHVRRWKPRELLRLFGFGETWLDLDSDDQEEEPIRLQTQYKLIGNSINVHVVSILLFHLLVDSSLDTQSLHDRTTDVSE